MVTVYVGSLWHRDCDPFATVVARDYTTAHRLLQEWADDEYDRIVNDTPEDEPDPEDDICGGDVFAEYRDTLHLSLREGAELDTEGWTSLQASVSNVSNRYDMESFYSGASGSVVSHSPAM